MRGHIRHISPRALTLLVAVLLLAAVIPVAAPAGATPIDDKRAQARAIQDQIDASTQRIGALAEQYNGAVLELDRAQQEIVDAQAGIDAVRSRVESINGLVARSAASLYRRLVVGQGLDGFDASSVSELGSRRQYAKAERSRDDVLLGQLDDAKEELDRRRADAESARATAESERARLESARHDLEVATAAQQQVLGQVQGELAQLVQQEQQRRAAEALARARARFAPASRDNGNPELFPNLPPPGPAAAAAIEFARAQLGKPYVYAASGPNSYDCSGLVMAAYRSAGVSLYHYSGAQYQMLPHVSLDAMLPGDLVFWGRGGSEHVAIYVGAGRILEAGGSGHNVHIGPIWGRPVGAARPA